MSKSKMDRVASGEWDATDHGGGAPLSWHRPTIAEDAGVDRQVRKWERVLRKAHGRTRATLGFLSAAGILAIGGAFLYINAPPVRVSVERFVAAHVAPLSLAGREPAAVALIPSEPLPLALPAMSVEPPAAAPSAAPAQETPREASPTKTVARASRARVATNAVAQPIAAPSQRDARDDIYADPKSTPKPGTVELSMAADPPNALPDQDLPAKREAPPSPDIYDER